MEIGDVNGGGHFVNGNFALSMESSSCKWIPYLVNGNSRCKWVYYNKYALIKMFFSNLSLLFVILLTWNYGVRRKIWHQ